jgi:hypothetical protein
MVSFLPARVLRFHTLLSCRTGPLFSSTVKTATGRPVLAARPDPDEIIFSPPSCAQPAPVHYFSDLPADRRFSDFRGPLFVGALPFFPDFPLANFTFSVVTVLIALSEF